MSVFVVRGCCGEYSDFDFWDVVCYSGQEVADAHAERLNAWCRENGVDPAGIRKRPYRLSPTHCPHDPKFRTDYTGTKYEVFEIPEG